VGELLGVHLKVVEVAEVAVGPNGLHTLLDSPAEARRSATFARRVQEALERPAGEADDDPT
jgi:hypothetical protein